MNTLYSTRATRIIEKTVLENLPTGTLMQRAGQAAYQLAKNILAQSLSTEKKILVLVGPGNNGGDALETAANLANAGFFVSILRVLRSKNSSEEAKSALQKAAKSPAHWENALSIFETFENLKKQSWSLVIDGIFGIGLREELSGNIKELVAIINHIKCPILALDIPSGLNADTGTIIGNDMVAIKATHTITFITDKPGLHTNKGRDYAGEIHIAPLDIDQKYFISTPFYLNNPQLFANYLKPRQHDSHKGSYGRLVILGGDEGMGGALALASRTALMSGAGLCYAVYLKHAPIFDFSCPEIMLREAHRFNFLSHEYPILAIGPGLGRSAIAKEYLQQSLESDKIMVLDADALNHLAENNHLQQLLFERKSPSIITPHPLEAARLLKTDTLSIQKDRIYSAQKLSETFNTVTVLKGSGSIIASPTGQCIINPTGNPGLATAGTGDVLTGLIGALLAQGYPPFEAASAAVWLHGKAADNIATNLHGYTGILASELAKTIRAIMNNLIYQ